MTRHHHKFDTTVYGDEKRQRQIASVNAYVRERLFG